MNKIITGLINSTGIIFQKVIKTTAVAIQKFTAGKIICNIVTDKVGDSINVAI